MNVLFVTWDGPQVSYLEGLFLPIFKGLEAHGLRFAVLQFTWGGRDQVEAQARACAAQDISYWHAPVWRRAGALGPFMSAVAGAGHVRRAARRFGADVVMPRGLMPALAVLSGGAGRRPLVFDADGLQADERADFAGLDRRGPVYRLLRAVETQMVRRSRRVLVRTPAAAEILRHRAGPGAPPFCVVSNGRDPAIYRPGTAAGREAARRELGVGTQAPLLVYCGSLGRQYCLERMLGFFAAVSRVAPETRLLLLTGEVGVREQVERLMPALSDRVLIRRTSPLETPRYLAAADAGLAFRLPALSTQAVAPIKIGEYLLCGLPLIGTAAGGGLAPVFAAQGGGDVGAMDDYALERQAEWFCHAVLPEREAMRARARELGEAGYSLEASVGRYLVALDGV